MGVKIPSAAKKVISAAEALGLTVETRSFTYTKPAVIWASNGPGRSVGDIRTPEKEFDGLQIYAHHPTARLGFDATYADGFMQVKVCDPVGTPKELYVDYSYGPKAAGNYGYSVEHAEKLSAARDERYNDGTDIQIFSWYIEAANEFYGWIDEWLKVLKVDHPTISPKPRAPRKTAEELAAEREAAILDGGEWIA